MEEPYMDKNLIRKYLEGRTDEHERAQVTAWMQQPGAQRLFDEVWEELHPNMRYSPKDSVHNQVRMEAWKEAIRQRIGLVHSQPAHTVRSSFYRYAAVWALLILGISVWGVWQFGQQSQSSATEWLTQQNPYGQRSRIRLADGSVVYLGAGSNIRYPSCFNGDKREVFLEGEAFFEVAKDERRTFMVQSGSVQTRVLGTTFKVEAFDQAPIRVAVSSGKVQVRQLSDKNPQALAILTAGEQMYWDSVTERVSLTRTNAVTIDDWKEGRLVFNERPLQEIVRVLERTYNVRIAIKDTSVLNKRIRLTLAESQPLSRTMEVLAVVGGFQYRIGQGMVTMY